MYLETLLAVDGRCRWVSWHQARLQRTCRSLGFSVDYDLQDLLSPPDAGTYRCRVLYDARSCSVEYLPYVRRQVESLKLIEANGIAYRYKSTEREALDGLFSRRGEADDVLIVRNGYVTDTTIANTAFFINGKWLTPERPLLEGTVRARLLHQGFLQAADMTVQDAARAEKVAVMNALSGFVEVPGGILA